MSHGIRNHTLPRWYVGHIAESRRITATRLIMPLFVVAYLATLASYAGPAVVNYFHALTAAIH